MGNTTSIEDGGRGRRPAQKLSKPRTTPPDGGGRVNSSVVSDKPRPSVSSRTASLPYGSTPAPSPMFLSTDPTEEDQAEQSKEQTKPGSRSRSITRTASALFRSRSSQPSRKAQQRQDSVGTTTPSQAARISRANSVIVGRSEVYDFQSTFVSWTGTESRGSVNYDMNSYEANRLLHMSEEPLHDENSIYSGSHLQNPDPPGDGRIVQQPEFVERASVIGRASSDASLYAPMRRRSLVMVPGVATRRPDAIVMPKKTKARFSLPSTPSRRDSFESIGPDMLSIPPLIVDPESIPRVLTPSEENYGHTGAFRLGTLRITNGSPVRSPAVDSVRSPGSKLQAVPEARGSNDYFEHKRNEVNAFSVQQTSATVTGNQPLVQREDKYSVTSLAPPSTVRPGTNTSSLPSVQIQHLDSLAHNSFGETETSGLEITSKHTAMEDDLFDDDQQEYLTPEVLDVRLDLNAKSLPPRPRLISVGRSSREITRSDSGIAASPISEYSHKALTKSDSGYSSNISLRSLSTKPTTHEASLPSTREVDILPTDDLNDMSPTSVDSMLSDDSPPPVPRKDTPLARSRSTKDLVESISQPTGPRSPLQTSPKDAKHSPSHKAKHSCASDLPMSSPSSTSPSTPAPSLSISSASRKPGKLERLLSGARNPLTAHRTHPSEKNGIPPIPQDARMKLREHAGRFPSSIQRLTLKPKSSKETLGTILSVGSAELLGEEVVKMSALPQQGMVSAGHGERSQAGNLADKDHFMEAATTVVAAQKSIIRKPVPSRQTTGLARSESKAAEPVQSWVADTVVSSPLKGAFSDAVPVARTDGAVKQYSAPAKSVQRTSTMSAQVERDIGIRLSTSDIDMTAADTRGRTSILRLSASAEYVKKTKTPPPVSLRTRNIGPLRVPSPLRAKSTPPGASRPGVVPRPTLSRQSSRESVRSYPPAMDPQNRPTFLRTPSRENVWSYPPAQEVYQNLDQLRMISTTSMSSPTSPRYPTTSASEMIQNRGYRAPNWDVQTDHETRSRAGSLSYRESGFTRQQFQHDSGPSNSRPQQHHTRPTVQQIRHRSSYDGYSYQQVEEAARQYERDNGIHLSKPGYGPVRLTNPRSGQSPPHQRDQQGRCLPDPSRTHTRNWSTGSQGVSQPFRVLHSYNSPAYRNMPIWG